MKDKKLTSNYINEALYYLKQEADRRTVKLWRIQNGQLINIEDMTDEHLLNTIKHLENKRAEQETMNEVMASYPYWL